MNTIEINEPIIKTVFKDIEEKEIFIIPRFEKEGKVFMKLKGFTISTYENVGHYNAICFNDGSFTHLDYDEFVIPCESRLTVWKTYKES